MADPDQAAQVRDVAGMGSQMGFQIIDAACLESIQFGHDLREIMLPDGKGNRVEDRFVTDVACPDLLAKPGAAGKQQGGDGDGGQTCHEAQHFVGVGSAAVAEEKADDGKSGAGIGPARSTRPRSPIVGNQQHQRIKHGDGALQAGERIDCEYGSRCQSRQRNSGPVREGRDHG